MIRGLESGRRVALLVNECQRGLLETEHAVFPAIAEQATARGIVPRIAALLAAFRAAKLPVVYLPAIHRADYAGVPVNNAITAYTRKIGALREGSVQVQIAVGLEPQPSDFIVRRDFGLAAFYCTNVDALLRNLGVQTLVLSGVSSNLAIPGLTIAALDRAFQVVIAEDCTAGSSREVHDFVFQHFLPPLAAIASSAQIIDELRSRDA